MVELDVAISVMAKSLGLKFTKIEIAEIKFFLRTPEKVRFGLQNLWLLPQSLTFRDKLESLSYTFDFRTVELKKPAKTDFGDFCIKISERNLHIDSPIQFEVLIGNERIATFGFYLVVSPQKRITFVISNIQGVRKQKENLKKLSEFVKRNWRVFFCNFLIHLAKSRGFFCAGQIPESYGWNILKKIYELRIRQYIQTFLQAGLRPDQIDCSKIDVPSLRLNAEKRLAVIAKFGKRPEPKPARKKLEERKIKKEPRKPVGHL